ncbi:peptidase M13 [Porphyromonas sp. COT-052 OH4946]|uniref:Peptidase M13 n=1 Tax=Porphyromonas gulae TaxID=111105 RepID=A0A0A2FHC9_9PORP|nr:peptidase M13 [Porphyromonas sp. COT-052 OH4946]KGN87754.1 peptidase M13 [Porphyromonas gulae]
MGALVLTGCNGNKGQTNGTDRKREPVPAIDLSAMDTSVRPQDDFYRYCNGNWMKNNPLKPAYSRYGSFDILRDSTLERVHLIVDNLAAGQYEVGTNEYRIATLYRQAMDSVKRNKDGAAPLKEDLREIEAIADRAAMVKYAAAKDNMGGGTFFGSYVYADPKNSEMNIFHITQTGLALDNRDYYLKQDAKSQQIREAYVAYLNKIAKLAGYDEEAATRIAENAMKMETELAQICYSKEELRDTHRNYNKMAVKEFTDKYQGFDWTTYLADRQLASLEEWDVEQLDFFKKFDSWFAKADLNEMKDYLLAGTISGAANYLSDDFEQARFDFFGKTLSGTTEMHPRWKRSVGMVSGLLGEALGEVYVKQYFPPEAKERMLKLVKNLQTALGERINMLTWMGDSTKMKAQEKLNSFIVKIGYPDKWKDYSKMEIKGDSYYADIKRATKWMHDDNMADLGKPVDRERWLMNPQDVNAYYNPTTNEICFPAAILQPPFFNMDADDAVNYGGIGVVIGHEMTHGFDDQGRNFDKDGNMINWWTAEDAQKFEATARKLADQFSEIYVADGVRANGNMTLGENIADQGGLLVSYLAFRNAAKGEVMEEIDGFTPDQRFFIGYARLWGQNIRPEEVLRLTQIDVHSLGELRVNQALRNIDAFYEAFNIQPSDKMYLEPEKRVVVW